MKTKTSRKKVLAALAAALLAGGCASAPAVTASATEENRNMTSPTQTAAQQQTLYELFGSPDEWEMHVYTFPRGIDTFMPIKPDDLLQKKYGAAHYQHITDLQIIAATMEAFKGIEISTHPSQLIYTRVLIEFRHKNKDKTISLANDGDIMKFHVKKTGESWAEAMPAVVFRDAEKYYIVKRLYAEHLHSADPSR